MKKTMYLLMNMLILLSMFMAACTPAATPAAQPPAESTAVPSGGEATVAPPHRNTDSHIDHCATQERRCNQDHVLA